MSSKSKTAATKARKKAPPVERDPMRLSSKDQAMVQGTIDEEMRLGNMHSALRLEFLMREEEVREALKRLREKRQSVIEALARQYDVPEQGWMLDVQTMTWKPNPNATPSGSPAAVPAEVLEEE